MLCSVVRYGGYIECIFHAAFVGGHLSLGHDLCCLTDPLNVDKLDSGDLVHYISLCVAKH